MCRRRFTRRWSDAETLTPHSLLFAGVRPDIVADEHVFRLDVLVNDSGLVQFVERLGDLHQDDDPDQIVELRARQHAHAHVLRFEPVEHDARLGP